MAILWCFPSKAVTWANHVILAEAETILSATKMWPEDSRFSRYMIHVDWYSPAFILNECVTKRHPTVKSENIAQYYAVSAKRCEIGFRWYFLLRIVVTTSEYLANTVELTASPSSSLSLFRIWQGRSKRGHDPYCNSFTNGTPKQCSLAENIAHRRLCARKCWQLRVDGCSFCRLTTDRRVFVSVWCNRFVNILSRFFHATQQLTHSTAVIRLTLPQQIIVVLQYHYHPRGSGVLIILRTSVCMHACLSEYDSIRNPWLTKVIFGKPCKQGT